MLFTARRYASAVYAMALYPSVCVCLSVCLPQVGVLLKEQNVESRKQNHTIARDSSFLVPKMFGKFHRGHFQRGRQMQVGIG